ncbi:MAG TPA: STAS domain-containing protein [Burkholderiales bacterium]
MIRREGDRYLVEGNITLDTVTGVLADGIRSFEGKRPLVDLSAVKAVDSSALSLMLEWQRQLKRQGRDIVFTRLGANLTSLTHLYGIADLISIGAE